MIAIVKYNAGNVQSVMYALDRLQADYCWTNDPEMIRRADHVIFPGVGEAATAMQHLKADGLDTLLPDLRQPVLGICLGLQLFCTHSEENDTPCMGVFDVKVRKFHPMPGAPKVPHMGWNQVSPTAGPLLEGIPEPRWFYFVHSYYAEICPETAGVCHYGLPFSAILQKDNFYAVQFHPEKSGSAGLKLLDNFLQIT